MFLPSPKRDAAAVAGWEVLPLQSQSGVNMLCIRDRHTGKAYTQQNLECAAAALLRRLHFLSKEEFKAQLSTLYSMHIKPMQQYMTASQQRWVWAHQQQRAW